LLLLLLLGELFITIRTQSEGPSSTALQHCHLYQ